MASRGPIVRGYAVGVHGHPRATKDLDVWVEASPEQNSALDGCATSLRCTD
jgi:hypothetical protein